MAVRWYLRDGLSDRDVEELLAERGVEVDHVKRRLRPMGGLWTGRTGQIIVTRARIHAEAARRPR